MKIYLRQETREKWSIPFGKGLNLSLWFGQLSFESNCTKRMNGMLGVLFKGLFTRYDYIIRKFVLLLEYECLGVL